jgi:hypothetical protein
MSEPISRGTAPVNNRKLVFLNGNEVALIFETSDEMANFILSEVSPVDATSIPSASNIVAGDLYDSETNSFIRLERTADTVEAAAPIL